MSTSGAARGRGGRGCERLPPRAGRWSSRVLRRTQESKPTAPTSTMPTTTSCVGESTSSRSHPERSDCITTAPRIAPGIVPMPPANDVPPMTAAAITSSSFLDAQVRDGAVQTGRLDRRADRGQDAHQGEREHDRAADVDAAELGGLGVAADREDVTSEPPSVGEQGHHQRHADHDRGPGWRRRSGCGRPPGGSGCRAPARTGRRRCPASR